MFDVVVSGRKPTAIVYDQPIATPAGSKPVKWPRWPSRRKLRARRRG